MVVMVSNLNNDHLQYHSRTHLDLGGKYIIATSVLLEGEKKKEKERG